MAEPFIIGVTSQKGGVGKTAVSLNLAIALRLMNYSVLLIDGDASNPSIGLALGMEDATVGFRELVSGKASLDSVTLIYTAMAVAHGTTGLHVVLGTLHTKPFVPDPAQLLKLKKVLKNTDYDFIILDTAPGYYVDKSSFDFWNEGLVIATPDIPAVTSVLRLAEAFARAGTKCVLALNKVKLKTYELRLSEIEQAWGERIKAVLPEDDAVNEGFADRIPVYVRRPTAPFSRAIRILADAYARRIGLRESPLEIASREKKRVELVAKQKKGTRKAGPKKVRKKAKVRTRTAKRKPQMPNVQPKDQVLGPSNKATRRFRTKF